MKKGLLIALLAVVGVIALFYLVVLITAWV